MRGCFHFIIGVRGSSKEEILNTLKNKREKNWFEYRKGGVAVEWGNEEQLTSSSKVKLVEKML